MGNDPCNDGAMSELRDECERIARQMRHERLSGTAAKPLDDRNLDDLCAAMRTALTAALTKCSRYLPRDSVVIVDIAALRDSLGEPNV